MNGSFGVWIHENNDSGMRWALGGGLASGKPENYEREDCPDSCPNQAVREGQQGRAADLAGTGFTGHESLKNRAHNNDLRGDAERDIHGRHLDRGNIVIKCPDCP